MDFKALRSDEQMRIKILKKVKSDITNYDHIEDIDYYCDEAIKEMSDIVGSKDVDNTCKFDIAYFRFLLYVKQNDEISEAEMKIYEKALKIVKDAKYKSDEASDINTTSKMCLVGQRDKKWF